MRLAACGDLLTLLAASPGACLAAGVPGGAERGGPAGNAQRGGIRHHLQVSGWARGWVGDWRGQAGSLPPTMMQLLGPAIAPNLLCCVACPGCSERRGQSQKPEEIYQLIEELVPNGARPFLAPTLPRAAAPRCACWGQARAQADGCRLCNRPVTACVPPPPCSSRRCRPLPGDLWAQEQPARLLGHGAGPEAAQLP